MLYWDDVSDSFDGWMNLLRQLGGDLFINFGQEHTLDTGHEKQYWGEYDSTAPEESIKAIMGYGGQWPNLE